MIQEVLESLEHIDDDAVNFEFPIKLVRMDDKQEAEVILHFFFKFTKNVRGENVGPQFSFTF